MFLQCILSIIDEWNSLNGRRVYSLFSLNVGFLCIEIFPPFFCHCLGPSQLGFFTFSCLFFSQITNETKGWRWFFFLFKKTCRTTSFHFFFFFFSNVLLFGCCSPTSLCSFMDIEGRSIPAGLAVEEWWDPPPRRPSHPPQASLYFSFIWKLVKLVKLVNVYFVGTRSWKCRRMSSALKRNNQTVPTPIPNPLRYLLPVYS